jgi:drug/metabolite transporter (DMT)-like permease
MNLLLAALGALGYGLASVLQASGARTSAGGLHTLAAPTYLAGLVLDLLAWVASLAALRSLPVYEVQAILAGSLAVTTLTARVVLSYRLRRAELVAIGVTLAALVAIALSAGPQHPVAVGPAGQWALVVVALVVAVCGWLAARSRHAGTTGTLAGLAFGGAAVCARALPLPADPWADLLGTLGHVASNPIAWALAGFGVSGMLLYAQALEHGDVGPVTALLWIAEVVAPSAAGVLLLHDSVRSGWLPVAALGTAAAVLAAAVLAVAPGRDRGEADLQVPLSTL